MVFKHLCVLAVLVCAAQCTRELLQDSASLSGVNYAALQNANYTTLEKAKIGADNALLNVINAIEAKLFPYKFPNQVSPSPNTPPITASPMPTSNPPATTATPTPSSTPPQTTATPTPSSTPPQTTATPTPSSTPPATTPGACTGTILIAGGQQGTSSPNVEIYTVQSGTWAFAAPLTTGRTKFQMLTLPDGTVLAAGGVDPNGNPLATSELYNPNTGKWTVTNGPMMTARSSFQMVLFNGQALAVGGLGPTAGTTAEFYNAATGMWMQTGSMTYSRSNFQMRVQSSVKSVLAVGGGNAIAEVFDGTKWNNNGAAGALKLGDRRNFQMVALQNGNTLISGGYDPAGAAPLNTAEIYSYQTGIWAPTGAMSSARGDFRMIGLADSTVLAAGGASSGPINNPTAFLSSAEVYTPNAGTWGKPSDMTIKRELFSMTPISGCNGIFVAGGQGDSTGGTRSETYTPTASSWALSPTQLGIDLFSREMVVLT